MAVQGQHLLMPSLAISLIYWTDLHIGSVFTLYPLILPVSYITPHRPFVTAKCNIICL